MGARDATDDGQIEFNVLGGLNERPALSALPPPDFSLVHGLYMSESGSLTRLPGIDFINRASIEAIWQIAQLNDGTGNIVVQYADGTERLFTLPEIFDRDGDESDLTIGGGGESIITSTEDSFPQALIIHEEAQGTNGGAIGASLQTWYTWKLTSNPVNESSIVSTFTAYSGSPNPSTWIMGAGTYRIEAYCTVNATYSFLNTDLRTCTISVGVNATVTSYGHGMTTGDAFKLALGSGASLPTPLSTSTVYYVIAAGLTTDAFRFSDSFGGAAVTTSAAGVGFIYLRPQPKNAAATAVIFDETNSQIVGVFQPIVLQDSNASFGGNPSFTQSRQGVLVCNTAFQATGSAMYSLKVATSSTSGSSWGAIDYGRGRTHGVTATLTGSSATNRYAVIKITKATDV